MKMITSVSDDWLKSGKHPQKATARGPSTSIRLTNLRARRASNRETVEPMRPSLVSKNGSVDVVTRAQGTRLNYGR